MDTVPHSASDDNPSLYTVYALLDPRDNAVRYVGITCDVYARMRQHSRCEGNNAAKNAWIQELEREQLVFCMYSLEKVDTYEQALERELTWIRHFLQQGASLTNISGVPVDPDAQPVKKIRPYTPDEIARLFFLTTTGQAVSVNRATTKEFDEFIRQFLEIDENDKYPGWPLFQRRRAINFALKHQVELDFCEPVEEDSFFFVKGG